MVHLASSYHAPAQFAAMWSLVEIGARELLPMPNVTVPHAIGGAAWWELCWILVALTARRWEHLRALQMNLTIVFHVLNFEQSYVKCTAKGLVSDQLNVSQTFMHPDSRAIIRADVNCTMYKPVLTTYLPTSPYYFFSWEKKWERAKWLWTWTNLYIRSKWLVSMTAYSVYHCPAV